MTRRLASLVMMLTLSSFGLEGCFNYDGLHNSVSQLQRGPTWLNLEVVSLVTTKKTIFDHVATWVTGDDCSSPRAERNGPYCVHWPDPPVPPQQLYCYSSLAKANCYSQAYQQGNDHLIGFVPASSPIH